MKFEKEKIVAFYKRLISLYPPDFEKQFGESMEQTFNDLCNEQQKQAKPLSFGFIGWLSLETALGIIKENLMQIKKGITMENTFNKQKKSAIIGLIMALPLILAFLIASFNIEPLNHYLQTITTVNTDDGFQLNTVGKIFFISAILLLPIGFVISFSPLIQGISKSSLSLINPFNVLITAMLLLFTVCLFIGFMAEQYSCWKGICD